MKEETAAQPETESATPTPHPRSEDILVATLLGWRWMKSNGLAILLAPNADAEGTEPITEGEDLELDEHWDRFLPPFLTSAGAAADGLAYLKEQVPGIGRVVIKEEVMPVTNDNGEIVDTRSFWNAQIGQFENATKMNFSAAVCQAIVNAVTELRKREAAARESEA